MIETRNTPSARADEALPAPPPLSSRASLLLDFDGTLAEIAPRPDAVRVAAALPATLSRLAKRLEGRLAIVSGRGLVQIDAFLSVPGLAVAGSHGMEVRWPDGTTAPVPEIRGHDAIIAALQDFAAVHPGTVVERKPLGAALHYRGNPGAEAAVRALVEQLAARHGLTVQRGKQVFELRPAGRHKGDAIRLFMASEPFAAGIPWFLGDDVTDEDGFLAVRALGGEGVLIGAPRMTAARYALRDVAAVHHWLESGAAE